MPVRSFYISCLSPESINENRVTGRSSGLLAAEHLPAVVFLNPTRFLTPYGFAPQWSEDSAVRRAAGLSPTAYSYGDSAGIAPDFPFNPAGRQSLWEPFTQQMYGKEVDC